jgi:hypothetical protein
MEEETDTSVPADSQVIEISFSVRVPASLTHEQIAEKLTRALAPSRAEVIDYGPLALRTLEPHTPVPEPEFRSSSHPSSIFTPPPPPPAPAGLSWSIAIPPPKPSAGHTEPVWPGTGATPVPTPGPPQPIQGVGTNSPWKPPAQTSSSQKPTC